jgi:hypothetical protein
MRWAGYIARLSEIRNACITLDRKCGGKRTFGRPRCRREDAIEVVDKGIGWHVLNWIHLAQDWVQ